MSRLIKLVLVIGGLLVMAGIGGALYLWSNLQPVNSAHQTKVRFVVNPGQSTTSIAQKLSQEGLIRHPLLFRIEVRRRGWDSKLQAGSFELSPAMTLNQIIGELTTGAEDIWIVIPEGQRREEIADNLAAMTELASFDKQEFLSLTASSEGKLFPDSYLVPKQATASTIVSLLQRTFKQKIETGLAKELAASKHTQDEIIIMASLLEREARTYEQMRLVAGILWRRIDVGMPLQVDATLQYARGYSAQDSTWWPTPTSADRQRSGSYNTYSKLGLPPGPIANPGVDAIKAALNPQISDYLFYIHDSRGEIHPAKTLDEHNRNIEKYLR